VIYELYKKLREEDIFKLMSLDALPESVFLEEGLSRAKKMYLDSGRIPEGDFNKLVEQDPTEKKKYIEWICGMYVRGEKDLARFDVVKEFDELVKDNIVTGENADIGRFRTTEMMNDIVRGARGTVTRSQQKRGIKDLDKIPKEDTAFKNDKCVVVKPTTREKSCLYGRGSHWCTAAMTEEGDFNYFKDYYETRKAQLYYILPKVDIWTEILGREIPSTESERVEVYSIWGGHRLLGYEDERYTKIAVVVYLHEEREYRDYFDHIIDNATFNKIVYDGLGVGEDEEVVP